MPLEVGELTLNEVLTRLGYTTKPAGFWSAGSKEIMKDGVVVLVGDSKETWEWLRSSGQIV